MNSVNMTVAYPGMMNTMQKMRVLRRLAEKLDRKHASEWEHLDDFGAGRECGDLVARHQERELQRRVRTWIHQVWISTDDAVCLAKNLADLQACRTPGYGEREFVPNMSWRHPAWATLADVLGRAGLARWSEMDRFEKAGEEEFSRAVVRDARLQELRTWKRIRAAMSPVLDADVVVVPLDEVVNPKARA